MTILYSLLTIQLVIYSLLSKIVKFDLSLVPKILIIQLVDFDNFLVKNDYYLVTLSYSISHLQLTSKNSQIRLKFSC